MEIMCFLTFLNRRIPYWCLTWQSCVQPSVVGIQINCIGEYIMSYFLRSFYEFFWNVTMRHFDLNIFQSKKWFLNVRITFKKIYFYCRFDCDIYLRYWMISSFCSNVKIENYAGIYFRGLFLWLGNVCVEFIQLS